MLMAMGGTPNVYDTKKQSPLHIACDFGNFDVVKLLLKFNLSTTAKDVNGLTPYDYAKRNENQEILDELIKYDAEKPSTKVTGRDEHKSSREESNENHESNDESK